MLTEGSVVFKTMNTDVSPFHQPAGTYRFALNALTEGEEGQVGELPSDVGNKICVEIPQGYQPLG